MSIDTEAMAASWIEAVAHGEAEGFSRHFVPDLIDEIRRLSSLPSGLSEEESDAMNRVREGKWLRLDLVLNDVQVLAACVRRLIGEKKS